MRSVFGNAAAVASELQGRFLPERDKIVPPFKFAGVARYLWPHKTAAHLAAVAGKDERAAKRWLAGEFEPPPVIFLAIFAECLKREGQE